MSWYTCMHCNKLNASSWYDNNWKTTHITILLIGVHGNQFPLDVPDKVNPESLRAAIRFLIEHQNLAFSYGWTQGGWTFGVDWGLRMALGIESAVPLLYRGLIPNNDLPFLVGVKRGANWYRFDFENHLSFK